MANSKDSEIYQNKDITLNLNSGAIHIENKASIKQRLAWLFLAWKAIPILKTFEEDNLDEKIIKIFRAEKIYGGFESATDNYQTDGKNYLHFFCTDGFIGIKELQAAGKKRMEIKDFLRGYSFKNKPTQ